MYEFYLFFKILPILYSKVQGYFYNSYSSK